MLEGCDVRISGQDVGRGTFNQRHAMLVDQRTERVHVPLNEVLRTEAKLELANSTSFHPCSLLSSLMPIAYCRLLERDGCTWGELIPFRISD